MLRKLALLGAFGWLAVAASSQSPGAPPPGLQLISKTAKTYASDRKDMPMTAPRPLVNQKLNRLTFLSDKVTILVEAGPAENMMSFRIGGLINPEISLPRGATVTFAVVNVDDDMIHNFVLTGHAPPYAAKAGVPLLVGAPGLVPHKDDGPYHGELLVVKATAPAHDYYLCTVTGHAKAGMFGKLTIATPH